MVHFQMLASKLRKCNDCKVLLSCFWGLTGAQGRAYVVLRRRIVSKLGNVLLWIAQQVYRLQGARQLMWWQFYL